MAKLRDVCRSIRSKNAGPFWVTIDFFFNGAESFGKYHDSPALSAEAFAARFGTDAPMVKLFPVENLNVLKVSYPRKSPQGGVVERDMHSGQQYVRLLDIELD
jgi:Domain of unknown function (DUF4387)